MQPHFIAPTPRRAGAVEVERPGAVARTMDPLWASLPNELRQLVAAAYASIATSYELALAAPLDHAFLIAVRDERERRTTPWRGGPCFNDVNRSDVPNDRAWQYHFNPLFEDAQPASPAEVERQTLARACDSGDLEVVRQQIAKGVVLDFFNDSDTPLYLAVRKGHTTCVRALLVARASLLDVPCYADDNAGLYFRALRKGNLDVVKVLTEFGMPRWGRSFALLGNECEVAELWAAEYCGAQEEVREFLFATRKFNPRAGDPKVYLRLQAMEQIEQIQLPMEQSEGNDEQLCPRRAIRGLRFLAGCGNLSGYFDFQGTEYVDYDLDGSGYEAVRDLLPVLRRVAAQSNNLQEKVPAELHELINDVERLPDEKLADERLLQLEEELSQNQSNPVPGRESLWAEVKTLLRDYPRLWTDLVLPEGAEVGAGAEAEAGAALRTYSHNPCLSLPNCSTGVLKELLQQRPPSVSDDELQFLLRQSPEAQHGQTNAPLGLGTCASSGHA